MNRIIKGTAALALSLTLFGCNSDMKTGQEQREMEKPSTKKVVNTGDGYITKSPISATPYSPYGDINRYIRGERYSRYYNYNYNYTRPNTGENVTTPTVPTPTVPNTTTPNTTTPNLSDSTLMQVVELTNIERRKVGLADLKMDTALSKVAGAKAVDMETKGYFSHTSPTYGSPFDMMRSFGISYRSAGENIAKGQRTAQQVVTDWMNSPGHRANIMNQSYTHIGVGHTSSTNCWVQMFISK
ncbi:CAP domain-containing protein [Ectobacillus antri]|jgi:uncharacterized YkwD family protein|uniref:CAP domain-containing protein n=1 Tax=Ectobacillus antri TaxID=2486280 RepID=A0ABT6H430_9BACI|nr:CAP domain-containing protein [Ectobacillus antri]MDG4657477.1 CAP domain-containing protein [Ectobacillus antri]MDG5753790.1 CAP domain-containing protein [Ectobacillus antri]